MREHILSAVTAFCCRQRTSKSVFVTRRTGGEPRVRCKMSAICRYSGSPKILLSWRRRSRLGE